MRSRRTPGIQHVIAVLCVLWMAFLPKASAQDTVAISFQCSQVAVGDQICVPVLVENFINISSATLLITWDPQVLDYIDVQNDFFAPNGAWNDPGPSDLRYIWVDPNIDGQTLPDGTSIFEVCFTAIGPPGSSSVMNIVPIVFNPNFTTEFGDPDAQIIDYTVEPCTVEIINPPNVLALISVCGSPDGVANGSFTITAAGGTAPYTYTWSGPANGSSAIASAGASETQSVPPGNYTITIMDASGASEMYMITIATSELEPVITIVREITCFSFSNGRVEVGAFNGAHPISVLWRNLLNPLYHGSGYLDNSADVYLLNSLPVGQYVITLVDANGCEREDTVVLTATPIVVDAVTTNATCNGTTDGSVTISFSGGRPYSGGIYEITPGWGGGTFMNTSPLVSAPVLGPGDYWVEVCDSINNCCVRDTFTVESNIEITANFVPEPPTCAGTPTARLQVSALTNGSVMGPYDFQLFNPGGNPVGGPVPGTLVQYTNLAPGNYTMIIYQGPCRSDTLSVTIPPREPLMISLVSVTASGCIQGQNTGSATVQASGGEPGYSFTWDGGALMGASVTGLSSGNHSVTVTDDNGCTSQLNVNVPQATGPNIIEIVPSNIGCTGGDVTLEVIFTEGSTPISQILWSTGDTTPVITGVGPGNVTVTIRDSLFCFDFASFMVPDAPMIVIDSVLIEHPTCAGDSDGQFAVFVSAGTEPYTYYWSTGDTTAFNLLAGLSAGTYSVTITDSDTCDISIDTMVTLMDPAAPEFNFNNIIPTTCHNSCDGVATLAPTGGIPGFPYTFFWDCGLTESGMQSTATCLCPGYNRVVITQDDLCFYEDSVFVPFPDPVGVDTPVLQHISCHGLSDGQITVAGTGGTSPFTYVWSIPGAGDTQSNLPAGDYSVTVTDMQGCSAEQTLTITEPDSLILTIDSSKLRPISCNFANSGSITVEATGGNGSYDYTWSPDVSSGSVAGNIPAGTYQITVTDQTGCTDTTSVTLSGPMPVVSFLPMIDDPACFGALTAVTVDSASGGNGGYMWNVNGGAPLPLDSVVLLPSGIYNIITFDSTGCSDTMQIILNNPDPLEVMILPEDPILDLGDSVMLQVFIQGSQAPIDSVVWEPGMFLSCTDCPDPWASNVVPTVYTVTVWDTNGCSATLDVLVDVDNTRHVFIPNIFSPNFDGYNDELMIYVGEGVRKIHSYSIFDRWGAVMVQHSDIIITEGGLPIWDGTYRDKMMNPGVYVYMIQVEFADGEILTYRGDLTLLR